MQGDASRAVLACMLPTWAVPTSAEPTSPTPMSPRSNCKKPLPWKAPPCPVARCMKTDYERNRGMGRTGRQRFQFRIFAARRPDRSGSDRTLLADLGTRCKSVYTCRSRHGGGFGYFEIGG